MQNYRYVVRELRLQADQCAFCSGRLNRRDSH